MAFSAQALWQTAYLLRSNRSSSTKSGRPLGGVTEVPPTYRASGHVHRGTTPSPPTLISFEEGTITGACHHEVGDVHELEDAGSEGQVGVVAFDDQIDARAMEQVGN